MIIPYQEFAHTSNQRYNGLSCLILKHLQTHGLNLPHMFVGSWLLKCHSICINSFHEYIYIGFGKDLFHANAQNFDFNVILCGKMKY